MLIFKCRRFYSTPGRAGKLNIARYSICQQAWCVIGPTTSKNNHLMLKNMIELTAYIPAIQAVIKHATVPAIMALTTTCAIADL